MIFEVLIAAVEQTIYLTLLVSALSLQIGEFYSKDTFGLELGLEFWCPTESLQHTSLQGSYLGMALQRPPHKQV